MKLVDAMVDFQDSKFGKVVNAVVGTMVFVGAIGTMLTAGKNAVVGIKNAQDVKVPNEDVKADSVETEGEAVQGEVVDGVPEE